MLGLAARRMVKTLLVNGDDGRLVALVLRGDHELNPLKAQKLRGRGQPAVHGRGCADFSAGRL